MLHHPAQGQRLLARGSQHTPRQLQASVLPSVGVPDKQLFLSRRLCSNCGESVGFLLPAPALPVPRSSHILHASSSSTQLTSISSQTPSGNPPPSVDPVQRARKRQARFNKLVELRALYRDFIRAKALLKLQAPIYVPLSADEDADNEGDADREREVEEQERRKEAVDIVAEMLLTAEQIKTELRTLPPGFGDIFAPGKQSPQEYESLIRERARKYIAELRERVARELPHLPYPTLQAAQAALDARNGRYRFAREGPSSPLPGSNNSSSGSNSSSPTSSFNGSSTPAAQNNGLVLPGSQEAAQQLASSIGKLGQAEKVAEQFVATRIKPVLRKAREGEFVNIVKETGEYLSGLWSRLNGGGSRLIEPPLSPDLPLPLSTKPETELAISELSLEVDAIEAKLKEAARAREAKLRRMRAPEGRATMPFQLKILDEEVLKLSRALAVRMLQIEMEYAYSALEDEAIDISSDFEEIMKRQGSTSELRLLAAEFAFLDEQLSALAAQLDAGTEAGQQGSSGSAGLHAMPAGGSGGSTAFNSSPATTGTPAVSQAFVAAIGPGLSTNVVNVNGVPVSVEELLAALAAEVPDIRQRVGVPNQIVFGGQGFTLTKARLQIRDALDKLREAITFMLRGIKLLGSDISAAARLFGKAAIGGTLKPREVSALRRTARDLLTFIPFTIILIIPLTPLGHVLVFGFIQTYFPSFFPSCFTSKRQDLMVRYEELERQLRAARSQAEEVEEEAELVRAAAARASRLTGGGEGSTQAAASSSAGPASSTAAASEKTDSSGSGAGGVRNGHAVASGSQDGSSHNSSIVSDAWQNLTSLDQAASVAVAEQTAQVKALEERIAAVLDDVTLGEEPATSSTDSGSGGSTKRRVTRKA